jgi:hypothetical protein
MNDARNGDAPAPRPDAAEEAMKLLTMGLVLVGEGHREQGAPLIRDAVRSLGRGPAVRRLDLYASSALKGLLFAHGWPRDAAECQVIAETAAALGRALAHALDGE